MTQIQPVAGSDRLLTIEQIEEQIGLPRHYVRKLRADRLVDSYKLGRRVYISLNSLTGFLKKNRREAV
jgi:hypothetical protein